MFTDYQSGVKIMEELIASIISDYGAQIWIGFVTLFVTGFVMLFVKQLISDFALYIRARMGDIGEGQRIYWDGEIIIVDAIKFRHIKAHDDKKVYYIPIKSYIGGVVAYPKPRFDDFDEEKYHQKPWDGVTERRHSDS